MMAEEGEELSILEYARLHGLALNHLSQEPPSAALQTLRDFVKNSGPLQDDSHLINIDHTISVPFIESLAVDSATVKLLADVEATGTSSIDTHLKRLIDVRVSKKYRLATPLLKSDHCLDLKRFASGAQFELQDGSLPQEPLKQENDETLAFPTKFILLGADLCDEIAAKRITVDEESVQILRECMTENWTSEDETESWRHLFSYKKKTVMEPLTPPLMPWSPMITPYIPSSPGCHLPLLSDPPSLTGDDLLTVEDRIFKEDRLTLPRQGCLRALGLDPESLDMLSKGQIEDYSNFNLPSNNDDRDMSSLSQRNKAINCKVSPPLTPHTPIGTGPKIKSVQWKEVVEEMLLDKPFELEGNEVIEMANSLFHDTISKIADTARRMSEQEQLIEADTKARVKIPRINLDRPQGPWKYLENFSRGKTATLVRVAQFDFISAERNMVGLLPKWNKLPNRPIWTPFDPKLAIVSFDDKLGGDKELDEYLVEQGHINTSGDLVWKHPGLRVLRQEEEEDDDEEIGLGAPERDATMEIEPRNRKRKLEGEGEHAKFHNPVADTFNETKKSHRNTKSPRILRDSLYDSNSTRAFKIPGNKEMKLRSIQSTNIIPDEISFSLAGPIANLLHLRAPKGTKNVSKIELKPPNSSNHFKSQIETIQFEGVPAKPLSDESSQDTSQAPSFVASTHVHQCILSSDLLLKRTLMRTLQAILPNLSPITRDFSAHNTTTWQSGSVARSPIISSLAAEADIIISPSIAILLTNLASVRQKPLPGHKTKSQLQERIRKVSRRYENLIILISEGFIGPVVTNDPLDDQAIDALAELSGFCAALDTFTVYYYVPGGEENLARWIASFLVKYNGEWAPLLEEESMWELFMRRAGMGAFAAQVILADLKAPDGVDEGSTTKMGLFGLTAFLEMGNEERCRRFGALLGGHRVLERVGWVLEKKF